MWPAFPAVVGTCICDDRRGPEMFHMMGLQGVEMVAATSAPACSILRHGGELGLRGLCKSDIEMAQASDNRWKCRVSDPRTPLEAAALQANSTTCVCERSRIL